tara:strand:+ start:1295 stop:1636 length:342 start_codon:yes stop_codon:yes gene_type:complete
VSIGVVKETLGAPDILRNPSTTLSEAQKKRAKQEDFIFAFYKNKYWESTKILQGSMIFYGDVLSSGKKSKMVLTLEDGISRIIYDLVCVSLCAPKVIWISNINYLTQILITQT